MGLPEQLSSELQDACEYLAHRQPIPAISPRQKSEAPANSKIALFSGQIVLSNRLPDQD
jgi:hypothetical protein